MNLRKLLRHSHLYAGLEMELGRLHTLALKVKARWVIPRYIKHHSPRKLQIGAGPTISPEWLTTDIVAKLRRATIYLDAMQRFPIEDASFDYVFSEHMIEHISHPAACSMLAECARILKPGGRIRLATPDLDQMLALKHPPENLSSMQREYIAWVTKNFAPPDTPAEPIFVINNQFRNYGHQFLFDEPTLRSAMSQAGFVDIVRVAVGESHDPNLRGLEKHGINISNEAMNAFETMVLEGRRAA